MLRARNSVNREGSLLRLKAQGSRRKSDPKSRCRLGDRPYANQQIGKSSRSANHSIFQHRHLLQDLGGTGTVGEHIVAADFSIAEDKIAFGELRDVGLVRDQHDG
jgi:hypothetical protein